MKSGKAGTSPAMTPAPSAAPSRKRNTRQSGLASNLTGLSVAILTDERNVCRPQRDYHSGHAAE